MNEHAKTHPELIEENSFLKQKIQELEQSETERKRAEKETAIIAEIGRVIGSTLNIDKVYERFAAEVRKLIPFDRIHVNLKDLDGESFTIVYVSGLDIAGRRPGDKIPLVGSISEVLVRTRTGLCIHPVSEREIVDRFPSASAVTTFRAGMRSIIAVPLISRDEVIGVLHFRAKKPNAYTEQDLRLAERIGSQIAGAIANAQLYSDLKKTEKSLRESEKRFRTLVEHAAVGIAEVEAGTGRFFDVNPMLCEMVGRTEQEMLATTFMAITHPEDANLHPNLSKRMYGGELDHYSLEKRYLRKDGGIIWVNITISRLWKPEETPGRSIAIVHDITERKKAENEIRRVNMLLNAIIENIPNTIFLKDAKELRFVLLNRAGEDLTGYSRDDLRGKNDYDFVAKGQADFFTEKDREVLRGKGVVDIPEEPLQTRNKGVRILHTKKVPILNANGDPGYLLSISEDITDRKQAEESLRRSEGKYRHLFETMAQGVVYQAADGQIISANPAAERILGLSLDQMLGKTSLDPGWKSIREDGSELSGREYPAMVALRTGKPVERYIMSVINPPKNMCTWISVTAIPLFQPGETTPFQVYTTFDDITVHKCLNDDLIFKTKNLEEVNAALKVLINQVEEGKTELEGKILSNIQELVLPYVSRLKHTPLSNIQKNILQTTEYNLNNITSTFLSRLKTKFYNLTPRESEVATFVREGKSAKEIAEILCLSEKTIKLHRGSLREKLGLRNKKINLRSYLTSIQ